MTGYRPVLAFSLLLAAAFTLACGSSHKLETVTISPSTADAKNFTNGQVPFTATGTFNNSMSPTPLASKDVHWCVGIPLACATET